MFSLFLIEAHSFITCPSGINYHYNERFNFTIQKGQWHYFYTSHILRPYPLSFAIKSNNTVQIAIGNSTRCPCENDTMLMTVTPSMETFTRTGPIKLPNNNTITSIGIYSKYKDAFVIFKLEGQGRKPKWLTNTKKVIIIFICESVLTFSFVWFYVVPLPPKIKDN